ncbi:hypothetical protein [Limnohabitans sp.]|uniref:hypothetical protein n=1 Tax=Limnohabitans sp. TaxID=1907725 RepID=UPI003A4DC9EF
MFKGTGVDIPNRSADQVRSIFEELDQDRNGNLSRQEFIALWDALAKERCAADPKVVALGLCAFLDTNGDRKLQISELKKFLPLFGLKGMALAAIPLPDWASVDYRGLLR